MKIEREDPPNVVPPIKAIESKSVFGRGIRITRWAGDRSTADFRVYMVDKGGEKSGFDQLYYANELREFANELLKWAREVQEG